MPRVAPAVFISVQLPAAELPIEPPAIRAVPHLDVRQPLGDDRDDRGVDSNASACARGVEEKFRQVR